MKYFSLFIVLFLVFLKSEAQPVVWNKGLQAVSIGLNLSILKEEHPLNIDQADALFREGKFVASSQNILNFGFTESIYWLRFELDNKSGDSLLLSLEQAFLKEVSCYFKTKEGLWKRQIGGYKIPLAHKIIVDHAQVFPLFSGHSVCYVRLEPCIHAIPVQIFETKYWGLTTAQQKMTFGIYAGILLFAVIINVFLFFALRKLYFLHYAFLVFFYLLTSALVMDGYGIYLFPDIDLMFWYKIVPVVDMVAFLLYCISFFDLRTKHPFLYKVSLYAALFFCGYLLLLNYLPLLPVLLVNQVFALSVFVLGIRIGICAERAGNKLGYLFAFAYSIWFVLILIEAVYIQTGVPEHFGPISYVSTASFVEAFFLAFLQAKRFEWERKEDHLKQFEMENRMERMEQTFQSEILNTKLEIQEQTFSIVSQEIHDNVGQLLSLAKIQANIIEQKGHDSETFGLLKDNIGQAMTDLRNIAKNLNNHYIQNKSLSETIDNQVERINRLGFVKIDFAINGAERELDGQKKLVLYRIIQEAIQNVIKHAKASEVAIVLKYTPDVLQLTIADNGVGFDLATVIDQSSGLGLQNVIARAKLIGGEAVITSDINRGSTIQISTPYV